MKGEENYAVKPPTPKEKKPTGVCALERGIIDSLKGLTFKSKFW
jgi:hypothetical protein